MTTNTKVLAANEFYVISEHSRILNFSGTEEKETEYWLRDTSDEIVYCFKTMEDLNQYLSDNHITIAPNMGTVAISTLKKCTEYTKAFNSKTEGLVTININVLFDTVSAEISWEHMEDVSASTALQFAEWVKEAAEYVNDFPYTGLKVDWDA